MRIIQSLDMVEKILIKRTWKQRLFGRPWNPLRSHDAKMTPMDYAIQLPNGDLVVHPEMYRRGIASLEERSKSEANVGKAI